jgi:hypothetical protein
MFKQFCTQEKDRSALASDGSVPAPAVRLYYNPESPHICHPEHSEGSRIFSHIRRTDFSASP